MQGQIHTIIGPMFSGKTSFLLHHLERLARSGKSTVLFTADTRSQGSLTHSGEAVFEPIQLVRTRDSGDVFGRGIKHHVVGIDEAQFFDAQLVEQVMLLAECGKTVLAAGLDQDYKRDPFLTVLRLVSESERVTRLTAICTKCGSDLAIRSVRKTDSEERILEGADDVYAAYCRTCANQLLQHHALEEHKARDECTLERRKTDSAMAIR